MRLFVALHIDDHTRRRIVSFVASLRELAPNVRWMQEESWHVTLKFIGERPEALVGPIERALHTISAAPFDLSLRGHGFFPRERKPRVFWAGIAAGPQLGALVASVEEAVAVHGVAREEQEYSPHLTLARLPGGSGSPRARKGDRPNPNFDRLRQKLAAQPVVDFGTMKAREFFLYRSQLSPSGSHYTKLAAFALRSPANHE
jgi:2'-5' RNA ligase